MLDKRIAHNLLTLIRPRLEEAQALVEAAEALSAIINAPAPSELAPTMAAAPPEVPSG